eukprot:4824921-Amphidinium_carterae.1
MAATKRGEVVREAEQAELEDLKERYHKLLKENEELKKNTSIRSRLKDIFFGGPEWLTQTSALERQHSPGSSREEDDYSDSEDDFMSERHTLEAGMVGIYGSFGGTVEARGTDENGNEVRNVYEIAMPVEGDVPFMCLAPFLTQMRKAVHRRVETKEAEIK